MSEILTSSSVCHVKTAFVAENKSEGICKRESCSLSAIILVLLTNKPLETRINFPMKGSRTVKIKYFKQMSKETRGGMLAVRVQNGDASIRPVSDRSVSVSDLAAKL